MKYYKLQYNYSKLDKIHEFYLSDMRKDEYSFQYLWLFFYLGRLIPADHRRKFMLYPFERTWNLGDDVITLIEYTHHYHPRTVADYIWRRIRRIVYKDSVFDKLHHSQTKGDEP